MAKILLFLGAMSLISCASDSRYDRQPASRSGRPYKEPKTMNHRSVGTNGLYEACLKEWPELYCRNRMGR